MPEDAPAFQAVPRACWASRYSCPSRSARLRAFDAALSELAQASPQVKRAVIQAVAACIAADGQVTPEEGELLRAITAALACPMPPGL